MADGVKIKINGDDSGYQKTLDGLESATKASMADIKAGIDLATAALQKFASVAEKGIGYNAQIEQLSTSFEVMTGSAEKAAETVKKLRVMGAETPYEMTDLATITQLLMQYDFTADDALAKMSMLGDVAQGNKEAMNSIALGYAQMSSAGKVNLQDIKQMINGGFNPLQEISERTGESMESLYDRISKGKMSVDEITQSMIHATSEGGRFYQSMEKQSQTLNGQLSTLRDNADQLLGSLTEGLSEELRTEILPLANNMIGELQGAYAEGGVQGLIDSATTMIPDLLNMMSGEVQTAISSLSKWLPKGASTLMKAMPSALRSASAALPQLTTALFEVASTVITDLISMLPELVPELLKGIGNMLASVTVGVVDLISDVFKGAEKALKEIGALEKTAGETFAGLVNSVDQRTIDRLKKTVDVDINTDITVDDYQAKIDTAVESIETALKNVPGLTDAEREIIKNAIIEGSGMNAIQLAFDEMGVDSTAATTAIETAQNNINSVVEGLGLSEQAATHVQGLIANNASAAEIQAALESFGVDPGTAGTAAASITGEMETLNTALSGLGIDTAIIASLRSSLFVDKRMIELTLKTLGLSDADIATVLESYDTVAGSLTAGIDNIYTRIAEMFTDGIPESDADVQKAKTAIEQVAIDAKARLDKWYADKVAELNASGLSGEVLQNELLSAETQYNQLSAAIESTTNTALVQVEGMVGKSTAYCQEQVGYLQTTFGLIKDLSTQIDMLTDKDVTEAETSRKLVIAGVTNDAGTQLEAFLVTYKEYTDKVRQAEEDYLAAVEEARAAYEAGGSQEDYENAEEAARAELEKAKQYAADYYQQYVDQILAGIVQADPAANAAVQKYFDNTAVAGLAQQLVTALDNAFNSNLTGETNLTVADILESLDIDEGDLSNIAELLGITPEDLVNQLNNALKLGVGETALGSEVSGLDDTINTMFNNMLSAKGVDLSGIAATLATAIESGYLLPGINGVDYTSAARIFNTALAGVLTVDETAKAAAESAGGELLTNAETGADGSYDAGKGKGKDLADGYIDGINAKKREAYNAGYALAKESAKGVAAGQQSASPSKVAKGLGGDFGDGYSIGLQQSMMRAVAVARQLTGQIATAADISTSTRVNFSGLRQEIVLANEQVSTHINLDGHRIAEIQGYSNSAQIALDNQKIARGVGSR